MANIRAGMSGWTFAGWRGGFYPKGLKQAGELEYASRQVNSIEINGTFYALQKPATFQRWYDETPKDFCFAVKAPRYVTHIRRLKEVEEATANFFASGIFCLKEKLGPILWQFPPNVILKDDRFETFLELLPFDAKSAARLAKKHSAKVAGRNELGVHAGTTFRHAFEFRHPSFMNPDFIALLREYGVAVVFAHSGGLKSPYMEDVTADFIYARMHGQESAFKKGYSEKFLDGWAERVKTWTKGAQSPDAQCVLDQKPKIKKRDAFIYFDNDYKESAPENALSLMKKLGLSATPSARRKKAG